MDFYIGKGQRLVLAVSAQETEAVQIAVSNLETDLKKVLRKVEILRSGTEGADAGARIVVASVEHMASAVPPEILRDGVLRDGTGGWRREAYLHCVRDGVLYIIGTDRRGVIYGVYSFCEWMGVSPWYFWADVPVKMKECLRLPEGYRKADWPSVEYRGIFINDEEELEAWVKGHMGEGTIGVKTYEKVFELLLRLKGNYIWPAMHVNSFNMKPENGALADRMGIVVGTSHCDMLMRSNNREWKPWIAKKGYADAVYDYSVEGRNREILQEYWRESVEQNREFEICYTLGMRGIHDSGFETRGLEGRSKEEQMRAKVSLLEQVIRDQRKILEDVLDRKPLMTFIPYKEVLELYDNGLEVPEDMTLVWANDNYGYIRRYPSEREKKRPGGNGVYYHNSYWAPPSMSYVFLCSIPLAHTANELRKAWAEDIRKLWVMNVGAMKPLEQEIEFFLRLAWEIGKEGALTEDVEAWTADWIDRNFSGGIGGQTAALLNDFSQLTNVRKLENMDSGAFSQNAYGDEAAVRIHVYEELFEKGNALYAGLPAQERDAFFQMVLMRIHAGYFTNLAWYYGDRSGLCYDRGWGQAADHFVKRSIAFEDARRAMLHYYNKVMAGGKWNGILNPEGFPPPRAAMMPLRTPALSISERPGLDAAVWMDQKELSFVRPAEKWIELGNTGAGEAAYEVRWPEWLRLTETGYRTETDGSAAAGQDGWAGGVREQNCRDGAPEMRALHGSENGAGTNCLRGTLRTQKRLCFVPEDGTKARDGEILIYELEGGVPERRVCRASIPVHVIPWDKAGDGEIPAEDDGLIVIEADSAVSPDFRIVRRLGRCRGNLAEAVCDRCAPEGTEGELSAGTINGSSAGMAYRSSAEADRAVPDAVPLTYHFKNTTSGDALLEIWRFPSLNSTGRIRIGVSADGGPVWVVESPSTDEWRGNWKKNVLDNVDLLWLRLPGMTAGVHELRLYAVDRYFAFSRILIYFGERRENNLAGIGGPQSMPREFDVGRWCGQFYGKADLLPREQFYARPELEEDTVNVSMLSVQEEIWGRPVIPADYLREGGCLPTEKDGTVKWDAAAALAESGYACTKGVGWRHCQSESYGRTGLAMYRCGTDAVSSERGGADETPVLQYRFRVNGGIYTFWMLTKFNLGEESGYGVYVDGAQLPDERLYLKGRLWRYEAEQIYRWVPAAEISLDAGEHVLAVSSPDGGIRFDRFYLTKGKELPPTDAVWSGRK